MRLERRRGRRYALRSGTVSELRPELSRQALCIERQPPISDCGLKGFDSRFFVLVLWVVIDSLVEHQILRRFSEMLGY